MPSISVIVPVFNTESYLHNCLNSILDQTFTDFEILCVNDGSTDNSLKILEEYSQKDKRIKVISQANSGVSMARNNALDIATGDYIVFLDSDDCLPNYALNIFYNIAIKSKAEVIISTNYIFNSSPTQKAESVNYKLHTNPLKDILSTPKAFSGVTNKLYKKETLQNSRFINDIFFEDWPFITTLFAEIKSYASTNIPMYIYNQIQGSTMRSEWTEKKINSYMTGIQFVANFFKDRLDKKLAQKRICIAIKMCVNKTYKDKKNINNLSPILWENLKNLHSQEIFYWHQLPLKTLYRLWKMK